MTYLCTPAAIPYPVIKARDIGGTWRTARVIQVLLETPPSRFNLYENMESLRHLSDPKSNTKKIHSLVVHFFRLECQFHELIAIDSDRFRPITWFDVCNADVKISDSDKILCRVHQDQKEDDEWATCCCRFGSDRQHRTRW